MKKAIAIILTLVLVLTAVACSSEKAATGTPAASTTETKTETKTEPAKKKVLYSVGTTSVGGVYNTVATAWGQTLEKHSYVNWDVQTTGGAVGNLQLYANGEIDMPMSIAASMLAAQAGGSASFPNPITDLTVLMKVNQGFLHICARTGSGINSIEDLKGRKISTAEPGHSTELLINALFDVLGWDINTDIQSQKLNLQDSVDALADGRIDAMFYLGGWPVAAIQEACVTSGTGYMLSVSDELLAKIHEKYPHIVTGTADAGVFNNEQPINSLACNNFLCASEKMSEDDVYEMVKVLFENASEWQNCHKSVNNLTPANAVEGAPCPVHPGAIKYYKEVGAWSGN